MAYFRCSSGGGGSEGDFSLLSQGNAASSTYTLSNLTVGKKYLLVSTYSSSVSLSKTRCDVTSMGNGTYTKICNITEGDARGVGTITQIIPSATSTTVTFTAGCNYRLIGN